MRIGLCAREYVPSADVGGIEAYTHHLALGLRQIGHEVTILSEADGASVRTGGQPRVDSVVLHLPKLKSRVANWRLGPLVRRIPRAGLSTLWYSFALAQAVRRVAAKRPLDILEVPDWRGEGFGLALSKLTPVAVRLHTPHFVINQFDPGLPALDRLIIDALEKRAIVQADLILSPSLSLARIVARRYHLPPERIQVLRYPIDVNFFVPSANDGGGPRTILYAGRQNRRKGVHILAQAIPRVVRECPGTVFLFVSPETLSSAGTQALLRQTGALDHVRWLPPQSRAAMVSRYQASDICVVPSLYDNLPYAGLEAMACGKAVVASDAGGLAEIIAPGATGVLVPPGQPDALAEALIDLLTDERRRQDLGRNARTYVEENLSCPHIARATVQHYQRVLRDHLDA